MFDLSQSQLKRLTAVHGWSGTVLGLLLYAVVITGTVVVFSHEIAEWSVGGKRNVGVLGAGLDNKVRPVIDTMSKGYLEEVSIWADDRGNLNLFPHAHAPHPKTGKPSNYGAMFKLDGGSGEVLSRTDGFSRDNPSWHVASALEDFLVDLHVQLYVPRPWGYILTGILGLSVMAAGVTGFLMHRHLIRDLFVAERPGERLVSARDRHILAASWGLPFAFILGFTGSFFSFAGTLTFPLISQVAFGGDTMALRKTLFEAKVAEDPRPAPLASLDAMMAHSTAEAGAPIRFINIDNYGRADARVLIFHLPPSGHLGFERRIYSGADGKFLGVKPIVGTKPSAGADIYSLIWPLHTGEFAGVVSKSVWVGLGAAMAFVVISGMRLWLRRREEELLWRRFARATAVTAYGLPAAMVASAYAFFPALAWDDPFWWTPAGFLIGAALWIALGFLVPDTDRFARLSRRLIGGALIGLPVLRLGMGGTGWVDALAAGHGAVIAVDLSLALLGAGMLAWAARAQAGAPLRPQAEPAE